jgi:hypothetical protein
MSHVDEGALHAYLDGELSPAERVELEAHLAGCAACRTRLNDERALVQRAGELLARALPPERATPPLQQIERRRTRRRLGIPLSWAASVILAVGVGYYMRGSDDFVSREPAQELAVGTPELKDSGPTAPSAGTGSANTNAIGRVSAPAPQVAAERSAPVDAAADAAKREQSLALTQNKAQVPPPAAGVVAMEDRAVLRAVSPRAVPAPPPTAPAMPSAAAETEGARRVEARMAVRRDQVTTEWPIIRRASARDLLGADPVGVPGLAVRQMRSSPANDGTVLVEQTLDSSTVIQLYQRRLTGERDAAGYGTTERLARFVGELRIEIAGPLSQDSLNKLLELLKPLP